MKNLSNSCNDKEKQKHIIIGQNTSTYIIAVTLIIVITNIYSTNAT